LAKLAPIAQRGLATARNMRGRVLEYGVYVAASLVVMREVRSYGADIAQHAWQGALAFSFVVLISLRATCTCCSGLSERVVVRSDGNRNRDRRAVRT
jgi:hypothetical protein